MKFEVELYNDIAAGEIIELLNKLTEINSKNYDCLVLCILSHGYPGGIKIFIHNRFIGYVKLNK